MSCFRNAGARPLVLSAVLALVLLAAGSAPARAQGGPYAMADSSKKVQFAGIPIPTYNDTFGFGLGLLVGAYYKLNRDDDISPPSTTMLFGYYTSNKTWVAGVYQKLHLDQDTWRVEFGGGHASVNFQFYDHGFLPGSEGIFIPYNTGNWFGVVRGSRVVWKRFYLGLQYRYRDVTTAVEFPGEKSREFTRRSIYQGPGLLASYDTRDNIFNAREGWFADFTSYVSRESWNSDADFEHFEFSLSRYRPLDGNKVLAGRILTEIGAGDVPFEEQSVIGGRNLRGYTNGKNRADQIYTAEAEFRWNFKDRWGMVAFAGLGYAVDDISQIALEDTLPSVGAGLRFLVIRDFDINARIDVAFGRDDHGTYFSIGEAF